MSKVIHYLLLYLKGLAMGSADVVPGVSGGTIAFITGIYETLINSIKKIDLQALNFLRKFKFSTLWQHINGNFLLALLAGIASSILTLAKLITYLLASNPIQTWSFFFGLVVISALMVLREVKQWSLSIIFAIFIGCGIAFLITSATAAATPDSAWFLFVAGAVAICAMILPGISGSFILLLFGKYEYILSAIKHLKIIDLLCFALGCVVGILSFARLASWLFDKFHNLTIALLSGFMIGSLNKVWPWKETVATYIDRHNKVKPLYEVNIMPHEYLTQTGMDPHFIDAVGFAAMGFLIVLFIDRLASRLQKH